MADTLFINTRPTHRSDALNRLDVRVANLPLLAINDLSLTAGEQAMMGRFCHTNPYKALIVTSAESAKRAIRYLQNQGYNTAKDLTILSECIVIAVGSATAKALIDFGFTVILPATANNEGMLALDVIQRLTSGDQVMIWRGVGGRRLLHDDLIGRGVQIDAIEWYERTAPHDLINNHHTIAPLIDDAMARRTPVFMLIASQMAFEHWQSLNNPYAPHLHYLTLGERLFDIVKTEHPAAQVHLIDNLDAGHVGTIITRLSQDLKGR